MWAQVIQEIFSNDGCHLQVLGHPIGDDHSHAKVEKAKNSLSALQPG